MDIKAFLDAVGGQRRMGRLVSGDRTRVTCNNHEMQNIIAEHRGHPTLATADQESEAATFRW